MPRSLGATEHDGQRAIHSNECGRWLLSVCEGGTCTYLQQIPPAAHRKVAPLPDHTSPTDPSDEVHAKSRFSVSSRCSRSWLRRNERSIFSKSGCGTLALSCSMTAGSSSGSGVELAFKMN